MRPREIPAITKEAAARFWAKVDKKSPSECWPWTGSTTTSKGAIYGAWSYYDYAWKPHRIAYTLAVGPIPDGLTLDHVELRGCTSKLCCNPAHLEPVTQSVNTLRQYSSPARLYPLVCKRGHVKIFGDKNCKKCAVIAVAESQARKPEKYREMKRLQKQKERMRRAEVSV